LLTEAPAQWLVQNRALLVSTDGRRALDLAGGDGRNAAYLAQLGFEVDAVDISDVAIAALQTAAIDRYLAVNPYRIDLERDPLPGSNYNLIGQLNYLQRSLAEPLTRALAPGGILVVETVTRVHAEELGNHLDPRLRTGVPSLRPKRSSSVSISMVVSPSLRARTIGWTSSAFGG
jgi:SAM-dependent methyltransferase